MPSRGLIHCFTLKVITGRTRSTCSTPLALGTTSLTPRVLVVAWDRQSQNPPRETGSACALASPVSTLVIRYPSLSMPLHGRSTGVCQTGTHRACLGHSFLPTPGSMQRQRPLRPRYKLGAWPLFFCVAVSDHAHLYTNLPSLFSTDQLTSGFPAAGLRVHLMPSF